MITLLLGTGVRVSELVGLNIGDVDFKNNGIRILRKGGNEMIVYFGTEVEQALKDYLEISRTAITLVAGHEEALFLSGQRKRISVDAVEKMVKKYASAISVKTITPHKLRSTYGTALYRETGDIYLVADVFRHSDVNTTKKHYAKLSDERRRSASKAGVMGKSRIKDRFAPDRLTVFLHNQIVNRDRDSPSFSHPDSGKLTAKMGTTDFNP